MPATPTQDGGPCPHCGQTNPASRRFCSRCGYQLVAASAATARPGAPTQQGGWGNQRARAARREYRRSLPALYRWRRVLVTLASIVAVAVVLTLTGNNPVAWVQDKWHELTVDLVAVDGVTAAARPPGSVAASYDVRGLPGPRDVPWATAWRPDVPVSDDCGTSPAQGRILLRWAAPTRVRGLDVWAGLAKDDSSRETQYQPKVLGISWDGGCERADLDNSADKQRIELDTETEVDSLVISVDDAYPPEAAAPGSQLVALGGVEVLHQPD